MLSWGVHLDGLNDSAGVKFPPPLLYVAFLGLGILASFWYPVYLLPSALAWTLGWAILAGGVVLGPIWGVPTLHKAGTTMRPDKPTAKLWRLNSGVRDSEPNPIKPRFRSSLWGGRPCPPKLRNLR
jgi:hypothetical protein